MMSSNQGVQPNPVVSNVPVPLQAAPPTPPAVPVSPPAPDPIKQDYVDTVAEEHHMMRELPDLNGSAATQGDVKVSNGPQLEPILPVSPTPVAPEVVDTLAPVATEQKPLETEVLADESKSYKAQLDDMLTLAIEKGASDLHITPNYPPMLRIDSQLVNIGSQEMAIGRAEKIFKSVLSERLLNELEKYSDVDFSYPHISGNRFRVNIYMNKGSLAGAFRLIPNQIRSISDLGLPQVCYDLIKVPQGLILFTGPTGSGKSTSIAAMIQEINLNYSKHIVTIEDPIEYVFPKAKAMVNQRELGQDAHSWTRALRELLRQDPNVVLVGEMRDFETIASTITVAETGHLVFATLHTNSASQTIDRIIDVFPEGQQNQVRSQLANVITAVIAQRLIPVNKGGRKAAFEVMVATPGIKNAIREGKTYQIDNMIQTNADLGMITMEKSLLAMIKAGDITIEQALSFTSKPDELLSLLNKGK